MVYDVGFYASHEAYKRQCKAQRQAMSGKNNGTKYDDGTVIDAYFYEVDSVAGLIERKGEVI